MMSVPYKTEYRWPETQYPEPPIILHRMPIGHLLVHHNQHDDFSFDIPILCHNLFSIVHPCPVNSCCHVYPEVSFSKKNNKNLTYFDFYEFCPIWTYSINNLRCVFKPVDCRRIVARTPDGLRDKDSSVDVGIWPLSQDIRLLPGCDTCNRPGVLWLFGISRVTSPGTRDNWLFL